MKKLFLSLIAVSALSVSMAACSSPASSDAGVTGTWGAPDTSGEPSLTLQEDGTVYGSDGCNRMTGSYEADGNKITFGPLATTMMYCEGVDTWLSSGQSAVVDGDVMTVLNESGEEIGKLDRN